MYDSKMVDKIKRRMASYRQEIIELEREMTKLPAFSPDSGGDGEWAKAEMLTAYLQAAGFTVERYDAPDTRVSSGKRPNIAVRIAGSDRSKTTWVMGHIDVVPPGDLSLWSGDPWTMRIEGSRLIGRGVSDNQSGVISSIFALKCLCDEKLTPETDAAALLVADEETGSRYGVQYLLDIQGMFKPEDRLYIPDAGNEDGSMIEVAEKAKMWIKFTVLGKQGHAGSPSSGINANRAASDLIVRLHCLYKIFDKSDPLFESTSSFEPTKREANVQSINILPGKDVFYMDCRFLPCYQGENILLEIRRISDEIEAEYGVKVQIDNSQASDSLEPVDVQSSTVQSLIPAIKEIYGVDSKPHGIGGGTVAYYFRQRRIPAVVWMKTTGGAHQPDESVDVEEMIQNAMVFALVMMTPG